MKFKLQEINLVVYTLLFVTTVSRPELLALNILVTLVLFRILWRLRIRSVLDKEKLNTGLITLVMLLIPVVVVIMR